ncbi:MAG: amino acid adenylation domain-containing protein [Deltaproteobacteria bacterium]|nr:amino acid adenylation domain-containing protein [Deltaproteobacteria bacterium]
MRDRIARLEALSAEQQALLVRRLGARAAGAPGLEPVPRRPGVNVFRASFAQERLWFLEQVAAGNAAYTVAGAFEACGRLDLGALRTSFAAVIARHESFRTTFVGMDGRPMQVVSPVAPVAWTMRDLRDEGAPEAALRAEIDREVARPFDPSRGPLLRLRVLALGAGRHVVVLTMHHLIADAWSVGILVRELSALYRAAVRGEAAALDASVLQYADYAEWQRRAAGAGWDGATSYWRRQLEGAPYPDVAAGNRLAFRGGAVRGELGRGVTEGLRALARAEGVTAFAVALAAWKVVVARATALDDVTVLSPVANRERSELAAVVGFFVNLVALRTRLDDDPPVAELVRRVGRVVRDAFRHQALPFELVLGELGVDRTLARPPLSPFAFALERPVDGAIDLPGVRLAAIPLEIRTSRTDLALIVVEREAPAAWSARLEYDRGLYEAHEVAALLADFEACLGGFVADPTRRISTLRSPRALPPTAVADPATVWGRFLAQAAKSPRAVAVRAAARVLTYEGVRDRALALAARLGRTGIGRGDVVALAAARGPQWIAAVLGIWGAGGVYLPLDPRWPAARVRDVLERSGARVALCDDAAAEALVDGPARRSLRLDAAMVGAPDASAEAPAGPARDDVAYLLYTSGSTGVPKGALIEHAGLANHLDAKIALLGIGAGDRIAQTAPTTFDVSLWQGLAPLLVGAEVVVLDDAAATDPAGLPAAVARDGVTVLELVPSVLRLVLDAAADEEAALAGLRWLLVTGEALPPALCRRWLVRHPAIPLVNAYGPTECADDVAHHVVRTAPPEDAARVPIGTPIPGMSLVLLDARLAPVASGEVGEICVGGIGVGRGYHGDPARTAAVFIEPARSRGAALPRLYRTGDLGRRLPDGTFEWLGRVDTQVKLGGVRIEPEEVEAVLAMHPAVRCAAVVATPLDAPSRLVAYVAAALADAEAAADLAARLRAWAAERLPAAMVPAVVVVRAALPLTAHGKVDRRTLALEASNASPPRPTAPSAVPETPIERRLATLWTEILGVEVRAASDGFFALGGDSLAALRLVATARRYGIVLTAQQIFETPTLAALARVASAAPPPAEQGVVVGDVEPTPIQRMFLAADLPRPEHYNMAMLLEVDCRLEPTSLAVAVEHLVRHHDALRSRLRRDGGRPRLSIAGLEGPVPYTHVDLAGCDRSEAAAAIEAAAAAEQASLDLERGPIVRVRSFDLGAGRSSRLLVVVHHLACDAASWPILLEDLAAVYAQVEAGAPIVLPAKTTSYRAWAAHLAARARCEVRRDEAAFWAEQGAVAGARLRPARPVARPAVAEVAVHAAALDAVATAALSAVLARRGATMETALVSAVATAVAAVGADDRVLLYLERHGREAASAEIDVSRTVGWFTAVFPLCVRVAASRRPSDTLAAVDRQIRAVPSGGLGWGLAAFGPEATGGADGGLVGARPEISCNYLGRIDPPPGLGWRLAPESAGREVAAEGTRPTLLDVVAHVAAERLHVAWHYDAVAYERAAITALAARTLDELRGLAAGATAADEAPGRSS